MRATPVQLLGDGICGFHGSSGRAGRCWNTSFFHPTGDFNGDGKPDLATREFQQRYPDLLLNALPKLTAKPVLLTFFCGEASRARAHSGECDFVDSRLHLHSFLESGLARADANVPCYRWRKYCQLFADPRHLRQASIPERFVIRRLIFSKPRQP